MNQCPYSGWAPSTHIWCEEQICWWIREPANTFSNLTYVIIGVLILLNANKYNFPNLKLLGYFSILLGFMSGFYHASSSFLGEVLDYSSMFLISSFVLVANLSRMFQWSPKKMTIVASLIFIISVAVLVKLRTVGAVLFGLQVNAALVVELMLRKRAERKVIYRNLFISLGLFVFGWGIWNLDTHRIVCDPTNHIINGHAIWHVATGIAIYYIYQFYTQFELKHE